MVDNIDSPNPLQSGPQISDIKSNSVLSIPITSHKKKNNRNKNNKNIAQSTEPNSEPSSPSSTLTTNQLKQWKQRVASLKASLNNIQNEKRILAADLASATARANDAEQAEAAVNKGLITARTVINQRNRSISNLTVTNTTQRAELRRLEDDNKKLQLRFLLLKTVSANLREAREARDAVEAKLDESHSHVTRLTDKLKQAQATAVNLYAQLKFQEKLKHNITVLETQIQTLHHQKLSADQQAFRNVLKSGAAGAATTVVAVLVRGLMNRSREDRQL